MTETNTMEMPKVEGYEDKSTALIRQADEIQVITVEDLETAGILRKAFAGIRDQINKTFDPLISGAHQQHKALLSAKKKIDDPLAKKDTKVKLLMEDYHDEIERKRQKALADAEAERQRVERERVAEEARLQKEAEEEEAAGNTEKAEELIQQAATVETQPVEPTAVIPERVKSVGSSARQLWSAEVVDLMALVKAVAAGKAPLVCIQANQKILDSRARGEKKDLDIPGVRAVSRSSVARV